MDHQTVSAHTAPVGLPPTPISAYLKRAYPALPGWALRDALKKRDVRVNGVKCGADASVKGGDDVRVFADWARFCPPPPLLAEKDGLCAYEKPAGLPVDADADGVGADTMLARVRLLRPEAVLCHRLDAGTGGALLFALDEAAHARALSAFRERRVEKRYEAIVKGAPEPPEGALTDYLLKRADESRVYVVRAGASGAQRAELTYRTLEAFKRASRVEIRLGTGRTHQIRVQFAHAGHPLAGDDKYGDRAWNREIGKAEPLLWCVGLALDGLTARSEPKWNLIAKDGIL